MAKQSSTGYTMRLIHRYLGFFLAGIMAVYALSGIVLVFRNTDTFKKEVQIEKKLATNLSPQKLGSEIRIKRLNVDKQEGGIYYFKEGTYNTQTGVANYTKKELPYFLDKMTHLHKATTKDPLYWLNIFFGVALLFFVISAFWMFLPSSKVFRKGLYFTLGGIVLTLIMLFV
jgi:hypothetical protein